MGQYYKVVCIDENEERECVKSWDFGNGSKLMEHSYIGNDFVEAVMFLLAEIDGVKGRWSSKKLVWAGDYADDEGFIVGNTYNNSGEPISNVIQHIPSDYVYILNHTTKEYIDLNDYPRIENELVIHPLPLLTADGNGRGGGDYEGTDMEFVGRWKRDKISVVNQKPTDFIKINPTFKEI